MHKYYVLFNKKNKYCIVKKSFRWLWW